MLMLRKMTAAVAATALMLAAAAPSPAQPGGGESFKTTTLTTPVYMSWASPFSTSPGANITVTGSASPRSPGWPYKFYWSQSGAFTIQNLTLKVDGHDVSPGTPVAVTSGVLALKGDIPANAPVGGKVLVQVSMVDPDPLGVGAVSTITIMLPLTSVTADGWLGEGADIALAGINSNPRPDIVLMAIDPPAGPNHFRYKIGWDVDALGKTSSWSNTVYIPGGDLNDQGGGMAIGNINANPRPDMVLMSVDSSVPGPNGMRYKIGWDLDTSGNATGWTGLIGGVYGAGWDNQGGGAALVNLDTNPRPELVLMTIDNTATFNYYVYMIGWNINTAGVATSWTGPIYGPRVSALYDSAGGGVAFINLDSNPLPEIVLMGMEDATVGGNRAFHTIGWNVNAAGVATPTGPGGATWTSRPVMNGFAATTDGAGIAVGNIDADAYPEFILMGFDDDGGPNVFHYGVVQYP